MTLLDSPPRTIESDPDFGSAGLSSAPSQGESPRGDYPLGKSRVNNRRWFRRLRLARATALLAVVSLVAGTALVSSRIKSKAVAGPSIADAPTESPVRVGVTRVSLLSAPDLVSTFRGVVIPRREADLSFRRSGRIESISVEAGDVVRAGTVIGQLNTDDLQAELAVAESELSVSRAEYEEALAGPRNQTIRAAEARVAQLAAQEMAARKRLKRREVLVAQQATSKEELENERFSVSRLKASVDEAKSQLDELLEGTRSEQLKAAKSRVSMAQARVKLTEVAIEDSKLIAPFDCVVGERMQDEGAMASPSTETLSVIERPPLEARFGLPSSVARSISTGDSLEVSIGKEGFAHHEARVVRMQPRVDPVTRTREIVVQFGSADVSLVGEPATLMLPWQADASTTEDGRSRVWFPTGSLVRNVRGLWGVYVVDMSIEDPKSKAADNKVSGLVQLLDAKVIRTAGTLSLIEIALGEDQVIVIEGVHRIGPGARVVAAHPGPSTPRLKSLASGAIR